MVHGNGVNDYIWGPSFHRELCRWKARGFPIKIIKLHNVFKITGPQTLSIPYHWLQTLSIPYHWLPDPYLHLSDDPKHIFDTIVKDLKGKSFPEQEDHHGE